MRYLLILMLIIVLLFILAKGVKKNNGILELPFLSALVFFGYLLPQIFAVSNSRFLPPGGALERSIVMSILCLLGTYWGFYCSSKKSKLFYSWEFNYNKMLIGAYALTVFGIYFFRKVGELSAEVSLETGGQWSGPITIYVFLSGFLTVGLAISVMLYMYKPKISALICASLGILIYLDRIILQGRRSAMVELFIIIFFSIWFKRRYLPSKSIILTILFGGIILANSIGDYRSTLLKEDRTTWTGSGVSEVLKIDYIGNFKRAFTEGGGDWRNAISTIYFTDKDLNFDYGLSLWNNIVHRYVPGQIVGNDLKQSLVFDLATSSAVKSIYAGTVGTMVTGVAVSYSSFWYFGSFMFFIISFIFGRWYRGALDGNLSLQLVVILLAYPAILAYPSSTNQFFINLIFISISLIPVLFFARIRVIKNKLDKLVILK